MIREAPDARSRRPLVVVHVVLSLDLGGLERVVLDLTREEIGLGQRVAVICVEQTGRLAPQAEALGARVFCVHKPPGFRLGTIGRIRAVLRAIDPDIIHTHHLGALFYTGPAWRCPIVHTEHGKLGNESRRRRCLLRLAAGFTTRFIGVSGDITEEAVAKRIVPRRKAAVLPNGIDMTRFADRGGRAAVRDEFGIPAGAPVVGTVGGLREIKRQDRLIRAFARLRERIAGAHLLLVGDGVMMDALRELAEELGLGACVHFTGYQSDPARFYQALDVFALTSDSEGTPLSVLEAWATGLPAVATRVGGLPELFEDTRAGILVEPDDEAGLASALAALLVNPERSRALGEAGRKRVEQRYSLRRMADGYQDHYLEVLTREK
jgi:sugar transferase (PEP-CTERM/EpsH1 system associated)